MLGYMLVLHKEHNMFGDIMVSPIAVRGSGAHEADVSTHYLCTRAATSVACNHTLCAFMTCT